ncbi:MAG: filamentous hemagglutinin N-terminal domain-containing protein, partial [Campylobacteraceae bacterium]|nr:filamentous hemagglutinin N-terminal domain-containing protein [Campylobacteraceae bacterium]
MTFKNISLKQTLKQTISITLSFSLVFHQGLYAGEIVSDINAKKKYQAIIELAPNKKITVVNIVKPNANGLSHNKFTNYNVNKNGIILNNSNKANVKTQLAGYIYGNKNLRNSNTARTILNEVTSKNKTELRGYTEVAGSKAHVIIANPNGIYMNGAGFINTPKVTITTGTPNFLSNKLNSYDVNKGTIEIEGEILNLNNVNKAELYSDIVKINSKIYAKDLSIITGKNDIKTDGTVNKKVAKSSKTFSIDATLLGGIYANKILLIGTQDGVGINLPIEIQAQESLTLNADGKIILNKSKSKNLSIHSKSSSIESNNLLATNIILNADGEII